MAPVAHQDARRLVRLRCSKNGLDEVRGDSFLLLQAGGGVRPHGGGCHWLCQWLATINLPELSSAYWQDSPMLHRKTIRHYHEPGHLHEFTFSCYHRQPLLMKDAWCEKLARRVDAANEELGFKLVAFVFMPEHVHLMTYPVSKQPDLGLYLARIKQPFSKQMRQILSDDHPQWLEQLTVRERENKDCFRFWQAGPGFDRNIFSNEALMSSINYIHENPVKRGLCERAIDWKWSSARYYLSEPSRQQESDLPMIHGLPLGALD